MIKQINYQSKRTNFYLTKTKKFFQDNFNSAKAKIFKILKLIMKNSKNLKKNLAYKILKYLRWMMKHKKIV